MRLCGRNISPGELSNLLQTESLNELLERVHDRHEVHFTPVRVGQAVLDCLQISDMVVYLEHRLEQMETDKGVDALPLWAKIWLASLPLAMYMLRQTPRPGDLVLEIGAGLGLSGLFAAHRGFRVVISDNNPDALLFARINALQNGLANLVDVRFVDFLAGGRHGFFSHVIAAEVLYREHFFEPLLRFFRDNLRPGSGLEHLPEGEAGGSGEGLLAADAGRRALKFFVAAKDHFRISRSAVQIPQDWKESGPLSSLGERGGEDQTVYLYRMKPL